MTAFTQLKQADGTLVDFDPKPQQETKRPSRWSLSNWPVRWKVFAIVLVPLVLAGMFGGLRIYTSATQAADLRRAADRAEMVPAIESYMAALEDAMLASSTGGDAQAALTKFDTSRQELQRRLKDTEVAPDVSKGVTAVIGGGQALMDKVTSNSIGLRDRVQTYALILLPAEDAINGSVRVDDERIRAETLGLSRAVGARGQMMMQQLLVTLGGELPEPELRTSMITVAGTEPSTLFGMSQVLGVGSTDAQKLQGEFVKRMAIMSDPASILVNNPDLSASIRATRQIAGKIITDTTNSVTAAVEAQAKAARTAAIRDSVIVAGVMVVALVLVILVARSLVRPLRRLRDSALKVAHDELTREIDHVRAGGEPLAVEPIPVHTSEEVGQVAHAVDELHEQAVLLAGEQSRLQMQVSDMFETLSRRSRSLVDQQLSLIDRLERDEEDPERLESLFRLDHLAARMRRNGANLLVLSGATRVPREQAEPVPVSAIVNAAASEVEDYARVVTATVPESEILGNVAGDLVHLLAELVDNALRYSPPISQVRVSAVHTGNGALVIEVSDIGIGMTESDLRVANSRLQSGGEVNPYTARHMGLFVVGRLAAQHGLVVRLRSTIAGEPNSGTTAGVYLPASLLLRHGAPDHFDGPEYGTPADAHAGIVTALALDEDYADYGDRTDQLLAQEYTNGHSELPVTLLPQRNPGASGISDIPGVLATPAPEPPDEWPADSMPAQTPKSNPWGQPAAAPAAPPPNVADRAAPPPNVADRAAPTDTSAFFASRAQALSNGMPRQAQPAEPTQRAPQAGSAPASRDALSEPSRHAAHESSPTAGEDDAIYQKMLSEWLIDDPKQLADSSDLDWESVWDHGWSAAAAAEDAPVLQHTEEGLPLRQPGARLVPGAADSAGTDGQLNGGHHRNGGAHRSDDRDNEVASAAESDSGPQSVPHRDPDAVRATISNHFGGVHAGRSQAQETRGTDNE